MTHRTVKQSVRERMKRTGETYTEALRHVVRVQPLRLGMNRQDGRTVTWTPFDGTQPRMLRITGGFGTGKTVLAATLAEQVEQVHVLTDHPENYPDSVTFTSLDALMKGVTPDLTMLVVDLPAPASIEVAGPAARMARSKDFAVVTVEADGDSVWLASFNGVPAAQVAMRHGGAGHLFSTGSPDVPDVRLQVDRPYLVGAE